MSMFCNIYKFYCLSLDSSALPIDRAQPNSLRKNANYTEITRMVKMA